MNTRIEILTDEECAMVRQVVPDRSHETYRDIYDELLEDEYSFAFSAYFARPKSEIVHPKSEIFPVSPRTPSFKKTSGRKIFRRTFTFKDEKQGENVKKMFFFTLVPYFTYFAYFAYFGYYN